MKTDAIANAIANLSAPAAAPEITPEVQVSRVLDALPGLVGGVDHAIREQTGMYQPFVLLVFAGGTAMHAANFDPKQAQAAVKQLAARWDESPPTVDAGGGHAAA